MVSNISPTLLALLCIYQQSALVSLMEITPRQGDWEDLVMCPNYQQGNIVSGFQLTFDHYDPSNQEDKTILNGIWMGCGLPFQSEQNQESNTTWLNGAGKDNNTIRNSSVFGFPDQRFFCSGYAVGFRLRMQTAQNIHYREDDDQVGVVNVKMICQDGEELEGHDEKWDYYPVAEYSAEPLKCGDGMGVCGIQTQVLEVKLIGGATTTQLNNLRIQCCPVPYSDNSTVITLESDKVTTEKGYESPFTPTPRRLNVTLFEIKEGEIGRNETILIKSGECSAIPEGWRVSLGALQQKSVCIRLWETEECGGYTRCYCDSDYLLLDQTFKMSRNASWQGNVNALTPCFLEGGKEYTRAVIFSERDYQGELEGSIILQPAECLTFYEGDRWHNKIGSLIVTDGCLEYFNGEECSGDWERVEGGSPRNKLDERFEGKVKSVKNCAVIKNRH